MAAVCAARTRAVCSLRGCRARRRGACFTPHTCGTVCRASQIRGHFQAFLTGGVSALAFGYYTLHQDIWRAAEAVDDRLQRLGKETVATQAALQARVDTLENEVKRLSAAPK